MFPDRNSVQGLPIARSNIIQVSLREKNIYREQHHLGPFNGEQFI